MIGQVIPSLVLTIIAYPKKVALISIIQQMKSSFSKPPMMPLPPIGAMAGACRQKKKSPNCSLHIRKTAHPAVIAVHGLKTITAPVSMVLPSTMLLTTSCFSCLLRAPLMERLLVVMHYVRTGRVRFYTAGQILSTLRLWSITRLITSQRILFNASKGDLSAPLNEVRLQ